MNDLLSIDREIWTKEAGKRNWNINDGFTSNNLILETEYKGYRNFIDVGTAYYEGFNSITTRLRIKSCTPFDSNIESKLDIDEINQRLLKLRSGKLYVLNKEIRVESNGVNNKEEMLDTLIELSKIIIDTI